MAADLSVSVNSISPDGVSQLGISGLNVFKSTAGEACDAEEDRIYACKSVQVNRDGLIVSP